ncbi:malto-oligosyltrehalose trehalohydrolase [Brevundimonas sp. PAMC22021]|uniref:malto-oligosyltrehalose trehalohydrolase n=1 Tax=Brevundimonas sp. PAMC22021 TaxID=2861285 RepID=UPI001C62A16D|nr:malto-oligosyltrehalose trehalohydrolase [Brevundimonas sp. PAMC22021]QYF87831.1 malto-oligosyltrehalose trehalohydrolase [Brevundimonas sp. PAMC22021]
MSGQNLRAGARLIAPECTRFRLWAPDLSQAALEVEGREALPMTAGEDGWFEVEAEVRAGAAYRYRVAPDLAVPDPASRAQDGDVNDASLVVDPDAYRWRIEWAGRPWEEAVICEVHCGVLGGFSGVADYLPQLADLGVTAVQLMPVNDFSGHRNWGYDGVLPYAPDAAYGSPDDLKALVDRAHELGMMIFLDVVYNHFGPDGNYLNTYASRFFHPEKETPWGAAIAFDREPVARFFIDNARYWIEEFRFDGLRLDAVHAIGDDAFLDRLATEVREGAGDRRVHLILENEANDAERLERAYDAQWNDDFHNVMHVLLTGETSAYYQDFADDAEERLARCLGEGFIYQGEGSPNHDGSPRGKPSAHLRPTAFVSFLQNHDQIGNRAMGERLTHLVDHERLKAAVALQLLCPQIPLIFMGEETGSTSPFLFFTDFHDELADAVREGRRKEFAKFETFADSEARERIPDPNAPSTFEMSKVRPGEDADGWRDLYRRLLTLRREMITPGLSGAKSAGAQVLGDKAVAAAWTLGNGFRLSLALNLGEEAVAFADAPAVEPVFSIGDTATDGRIAPACLLAWLEPVG